MRFVVLILRQKEFVMKKTIFFSIVILITAACSSSKEEKSNDQQTETTQDQQVVNPSFYQEKFLRGVDFFARGNEPNWTLEMGFQTVFSFKSMYDSSITVTAVEGKKAMDADVMRYYSKDQNNELAITITKQPCQDNMSGEQFDCNVKIEIKKPNEKNYQTYNGCGRYLYDYRLNDIWVMETISGFELKKEELMKGFPTFEFNLKEMRFGGHAGCNNLFGKIELKGNQIKFGNIAATMMACPDMNIERAVIDALNLKSFAYRIENMKLTLENKSIKMIFKKVD